MVPGTFGYLESTDYSVRCHRFFKANKNKPIERLIPGREFHGTVVNSKCSKFEVGDHVVGLKHPTETFGTLSEYISSEGNCR